MQQCAPDRRSAFGYAPARGGVSFASSIIKEARPVVRHRIANVVQEIAGGDFDAETGSIVTASSARQSGLHRYLRAGSRNPRGYAPFAGNGSVSASRIGYRKCRSLHLSPRAVWYLVFPDAGGTINFKHLRRRR